MTNNVAVHLCPIVGLWNGLPVPSQTCLQSVCWPLWHCCLSVATPILDSLYPALMCGFMPSKEVGSASVMRWLVSKLSHTILIYWFLWDHLMLPSQEFLLCASSDHRPLPDRLSVARGHLPSPPRPKALLLLSSLPWNGPLWVTLDPTCPGWWPCSVLAWLTSQQQGTWCLLLTVLTR